MENFKINTIYNEDCFETMKQMPKIIDVVLTSPPYNTARTGTNQRAFDNYENRYEKYFDFHCSLISTENPKTSWIEATRAAFRFGRVSEYSCAVANLRLSEKSRVKTPSLNEIRRASK